MGFENSAASTKWAPKTYESLNLFYHPEPDFLYIGSMEMQKLKPYSHGEPLHDPEQKRPVVRISRARSRN